MVDNNKIIVPQDAIEKTKIVCSRELRSVQNKMEYHQSKIIFQFLIFELKRYFLLSFIGLALLSVLRVFGNDSQTLQLGIGAYFILVGCIAVFEYCRTGIYEMNDLLGATLIRPSKAIIYKVISITLIETVAFTIIAVLYEGVLETSIQSLVVYILIPLLLSQLLTLLLLGKVQSASAVGIASIGFYAVLMITFKSLEIRRFVDTREILWMLVFIIAGYIFVGVKAQRKNRSGLVVGV